MLFGDFNCSTKPGENFNEDTIFYNEKLLIVMDAATNLSKIRFTSEESDGCWLSKNTVSLLSEFLNDSTESIPHALERVSKILKDEINSLGCNNEELYPSGSIVIARIVNDTVEIFSIGDCSALIEFSNSCKKMLIRDDNISKMDNAALNQLKEWREQSGKPIIELTPQIREMLIKNRNKRNKENGYWIFDPTGIAIKYATTLKFNCSEIKSIALMSDGFYSISMFENFSDNSKIISALKSNPAGKMIDDIFEELNKDVQLNKYPRFKIKDDASVVFAKIK